MSSLNRVLAAIGGSLQSLFLLAVRLTWGWQFFVTGKGKLSNLGRVTGYFASLHIPAPHLNAIAVSVTECLGGLLLILGLGTRIVAPIFIFEMAIAYVTSEQEALRSFDYDKLTKVDPFLFILAAIILFVFGPGRIALDAVLFKEKKT